MVWIFSGIAHYYYYYYLQKGRQWKEWCHSLRALEDITVPALAVQRHYSTHMELHTFCDTSEMVISAVYYLRIVHDTSQAEVAFVLRRAKLTPAHAKSDSVTYY